VAGNFKKRARARLLVGSPCAYCRGPATTLDHVVPRSRGGRGTITNAVPACGPCNNVKGSVPVERFVAWLLTPAGACWAGVAPAFRSVSKGVGLFLEYLGVERAKRRANRGRAKLPIVSPEEALGAWPRARDDYEGPNR
jgi:hypothetical protein